MNARVIVVCLFLFLLHGFVGAVDAQENDGPDISIFLSPTFEQLSTFDADLPFRSFLRHVVPIANYDYDRAIRYYERIYGKRPSAEHNLDHQEIGLVVDASRQDRHISEFEAISEFIDGRMLVWDVAYDPHMSLQDFLRYIVPQSGFKWAKAIEYFEVVYGRRPNAELTIDHNLLGLTVTDWGRMRRNISEFEVIREFLDNRTIKGQYVDDAFIANIFTPEAQRLSNTSPSTGFTGGGLGRPTVVGDNMGDYDPAEYGEWVTDNFDHIIITRTVGQSVYHRIDKTRYNPSYDEGAETLSSASFNGEVAGRYSNDFAKTWSPRTGSVRIAINGDASAFTATFRDVPLFDTFEGKVKGRLSGVVTVRFPLRRGQRRVELDAEYDRARIRRGRGQHHWRVERREVHLGRQPAAGTV